MPIASDKRIAQQVVAQSVANGVKHVVCSPGSRNAPLVIAFDENPQVCCYVVHDERSAGFFALGIAQMLNEPVAVLCTSGSAAVNYFPAVTEAFYQYLPLVVITADRPAAWVDQGDGQTIVQKNLFGKHVRYSCDFGEGIHDNESLWHVNRELATAFNLCNGEWKGPIHINVGMSEPLYGKVDCAEINVQRIETVRGCFKLPDRRRTEMEQALSGTRKLVLIGQHRPDEALLRQMEQFSDDTDVAVLVENTSNLQHERFVHCIDRALNSITEEELPDFAPDVLISIGGAVVSKRIKSFLRKNRPKQHWKVGFEFPFMDTFQCLTHSFQSDPVDFMKELNSLNYSRNTLNFSSKWRQKDLLARDRMGEFFDRVRFSDIKVFELILDYLPERTQLHMANSSVIRYCQLFDPVRSIKYWSNRGTSGIDGSTSTAVGAAKAAPDDLHVLITGDISFFYDSNALWNKYLSNNLRIILINNRGGGIFRIIPGPSETAQGKKYFEAHHEQEADKLCEAFGITYHRAECSKDIELCMETFYAKKNTGRSELIEIITPREVNDGELEAFFKALR